MKCSCHSHNGFVLSEQLDLECQIAQQESESEQGLTRSVNDVSIDKSGSVSALRRDGTMLIFDDAVLEEQYRRFISV